MSLRYTFNWALSFGLFIAGSNSLAQMNDLRQKSFIELLNLNEARFYNLLPADEIKPNLFKLAKVEEHNHKVGKDSPLFISYSAVTQIIKKKDPEDNRELLDIEFKGLDADQFNTLKALYGGVTQLMPKTDRRDYRLSDFMPPLLQALEGHAFLGDGKDLEIINTTTRGPRNVGSTNTRVQVFTNCWSTVYELLSRGGFRAKQQDSLQELSVFVIDDVTVEESFKKYGQVIKKIMFPTMSPIEVNDTRFGDVVLIKPIHLSEDGQKYPILEHVAVVIDKNLVFEKANADPIDPYRFYPLDKTVKRFLDRPLFHVVGVQIEILRFEKSLPPARQEFSGYRNAQKDIWSWPLIGNLNELLLLSKNQYGPGYNAYYNSFGMIVDVGLEVDQESGRFRLSNEAYNKQTFDFDMLIQRFSR